MNRSTFRDLWLGIVFVKICIIPFNKLLFFKGKHIHHMLDLSILMRLTGSTKDFLYKGLYVRRPFKCYTLTFWTRTNQLDHVRTRYWWWCRRFDQFCFTCVNSMTEDHMLLKVVKCQCQGLLVMAVQTRPNMPYFESFEALGEYTPTTGVNILRGCHQSSKPIPNMLFCTSLGTMTLGSSSRKLKFSRYFFFGGGGGTFSRDCSIWCCETSEVYTRRVWGLALSHCIGSLHIGSKSLYRKIP